MDPVITRAAQTLADHATLLLALGIGIVGVAMAPTASISWAA
jgi:hypothetical protein